MVGDKKWEAWVAKLGALLVILRCAFSKPPTSMKPSAG